MPNNLVTSDGENVQIIEVGKHNVNAGPDFINAKIRIGKLVFCGNVELHIKASEWYNHSHHLDAQYNNVILHVVIENNKVVNTQNGYAIPTLELSSLKGLDLKPLVDRLASSEKRLSCVDSFQSLSKLNQIDFLDKLTFNRIEKKKNQLKTIKDSEDLDWNDLFLVGLLRSMGIPANKIPMEQVALRLESTILFKIRSDIELLLAYIFGTASMLPEGNEYARSLHKKYLFLKHKYHFETKGVSFNWKQSRMRVFSNPTKRLVEFAFLIYQQSIWMSEWTKEPSIENWKKFFDFSKNQYWSKHFDFEKPFQSLQEKPTENLIKQTYINFAIPFSMIYTDNATVGIVEESLMALKEERNYIIRKWKDSGLSSTNSWDSQALIHLEKEYCSQKKCLNCKLGRLILKDEQTRCHFKRKVRESSIRSLPMVGR